jgi:hypothetical protein
MRLEVKSKDWKWIIALVIVCALITTGQAQAAVELLLKLWGK